MSLNVAHSQEGPVAARTGLKTSIGGPGVRKCIRGGSCEMGKNENSCLACCQPASADCSEELLLRDGIPNDTAAAIATNCFDLIYFSFYNPPPAPPTPTTPTPRSHCCSSSLPPNIASQAFSFPLCLVLPQSPSPSVVIDTYTVCVAGHHLLVCTMPVAGNICL